MPYSLLRTIFRASLTDMKEFFLVLLGFVLAVVPLWFDRKRRLKGHFYALRAELDLCKEKAAIFLKDEIASPLYRMPLRVYEVAVPILLTEGAVTESETASLARFYSQAEDINRGLDNAAAMLARDDDEGLKREVGRLIKKANEMIGPTKKGEPLYTDAKTIIDRKIEQDWWQY